MLTINADRSIGNNISVHQTYDKCEPRSIKPASTGHWSSSAPGKVCPGQGQHRPRSVPVKVCIGQRLKQSMSALVNAALVMVSVGQGQH